MLVRIARLNALQHCYKPLPNFAPPPHPLQLPPLHQRVHLSKVPV